MAALKYKTRGNSSVQGKPKVYFTCHPADFNIYFEKISDEILEKQNCSVWYLDEKAKTPDGVLESDIENDITEMQLVVIPVTMRFLTENNRARDVDFKKASEKHIPILPLVQEQGLTQLFSKVCGDLQYLDFTANEKDTTAISYDVKLDKFLNSVLIGDELAKKVRAAFDAYIFLSYRKKDRAFAKQLMSLIHNNDFCRDFAIWYDEYLVPGEDFNNAIKQALDNSDLFTLVVTPNLLEEGNYVVKYEFPMARDAGKKILPVELVSTDREKLAKAYERIPDVTNGNDSALLAEALEKSINRTAKSEKRDDPAHTFFIGLAYLLGIDMEVNHKKAVELITYAAENGVTEALDKLVSMYRHGEAVERSYDKAIEWQKKLCDTYKNSYDKSKGVKECNSYVDELLDLGTFYLELQKYEEASEVLFEAVKVCELVLDKFNDSETEHLLFVSYFYLTVVLKDSDKAKAKEFGRLFCEKSRELHRKNPSSDTAYDTAVSYMTLGGLHLDEKELDEAFENYNEAMKYLDFMNDCANKTFELANVNCYMGDVQLFDEKYDTAYGYYTKAVDLYKGLADEFRTYKYRRNLAISYSKLGRIKEAERKYADAIGYYEKDTELVKALAEETGRFDTLHELALCYENLGHAHYYDGNLVESKNKYTESHILIEKLCESSKTNKLTLDLARSCFNIGMICAEEGDLVNAEKCYNRSLELNESIEEIESHHSAKREILVLHCYIGDVFRRREEYLYANRHYRRYYDLSKELYEKTGLTSVKREHAVSCQKRGQVCFMQENYESAWKFFSESERLIKELLDERYTLESSQDLANIYYNLMRTAHMLGKKEECEDYLSKAVDLSENLAKNPGTRTDRNILASVYLFLAFYKKDKMSAAKARDLWKKLSRECPAIGEYKESMREATKYL